MLGPLSYIVLLKINELILTFFLFSILSSVASINTSNVLPENPKVIRKIFSLFKELYDINPVISQGKSHNFNNKSYYNLVVLEKVPLILQDLMVENEKVSDYFLDSSDLKRAYLRGAFLASGSVNDPKKSRYHLEFLVDSFLEAKFLCELLNVFNINAKVISRDKGYMTYVKEAEKIGDFLRLMGTNQAILYYEDIRIYRDHKNMTNRLNNCEQANVDKAINASKRQLEDIAIIKEKLGISLLDDKLKEAIIYREKYPDVSLLELSAIISQETEKKLTKSGLNHRFRKIHEIALKLK